jgi:hypothetical protein
VIQKQQQWNKNSSISSSSLMNFDVPAGALQRLPGAPIVKRALNLYMLATVAPCDTKTGIGG